MIVDVDVGNTRLKWRACDSGRLVSRGAQAHAEGLRALRELEGTVQRLRVASVRGSCDEALRRLAREAWGIEAEFARVLPGCAGLRCGYREPANLGVDRWLALLAAWTACPGPLLVASAGTALTLDLVDADGQHLGGYILPGFAAMRASLGLSTWGVRVEDPPPPELSPGADTPEAVVNGSLSAMVGALQTVGNTAPDATLFLTGGDAPLLASHIPGTRAVRVEPDLVLHGLAIAMP